MNFLFWASQERPPARPPGRPPLLILGLLAASAVVLVGRTWVGGGEIDPVGSPFLIQHDLETASAPANPNPNRDRSPDATGRRADGGPAFLRTSG
jgi:hypothetical protein